MQTRWLTGTDASIATLLLATTVFLSYFISGSLLPHLTPIGTFDTWFEGDIPRFWSIMFDRWTHHESTNKHPLYSLLAYPPVIFLSKLGLTKLAAIRLFVALTSALSIAGVYAVCRLLGCRIVYAVLFSLLMLSSAGFMFWFVVPETHNLAMITVLLAILVAAAKSRKYKVSEGTDICMMAATLSITITNWMYGMLAAFTGRPIKRWPVLFLASLGLVVIAWGFEKSIFPSAEFFIGHNAASEHFLSPESRGFIGVFISFFYHTIVMPVIQVVDRPSTADWPIMITQGSAAGSAGIFGLVSVVLWTVLFLGGLYTLLKTQWLRPLALFLVAGLLGQLCLYWLFGNETFLYTGNFIPLLIITASIGSLGKQHRLIGLVTVTLLITTSANNIGQFRKAHGFFETFKAYHHSVELARINRPAEHWSRSTESVQLGNNGERVFDRGFHQAGGNFSPAFGSFGISIWVYNRDGQLVTTSVDIPEREIQESKTKSTKSFATRIITKTPYYQVSWSKNGLRDWNVEISDVADGYSLEIMIRSDGPEGGPIRQLQSIEAGVMVNQRWNVTFTPAPQIVMLGKERKGNWWSTSSPVSSVQDNGGWGFARLRFIDGGQWKGRIYDTKARQGIDDPIAVLR